MRATKIDTFDKLSLRKKVQTYITMAIGVGVFADVVFGFAHCRNGKYKSFKSMIILTVTHVPCLLCHGWVGLGSYS